MRFLTCNILSAVLLVMLTGCPGPEPAKSAVAPDSAVTPCATCTGSDTTGAICDDVVPQDTTPADSAPQRVQKPAAEKVRPKLWEFGRGTCIPCKTMKGILDPMVPEFAGKVEIRMLNIDDEPALTRQYHIQMIPTQVFISSDGNELFRHVGVYERDSIVAKFKELGWE